MTCQACIHFLPRHPDGYDWGMCGLDAEKLPCFPTDAACHEFEADTNARDDGSRARDTVRRDVGSSVGGDK
jgi:hypothetical protein